MKCLLRSGLLAMPQSYVERSLPRERDSLEGFGCGLFHRVIHPLLIFGVGTDIGKGSRGAGRAKMLFITLIARFGWSVTLPFLQSNHPTDCHSSNICSFLYPAYASYKALSIHPQSDPVAGQQVERWLMYWAVVGTWTAVEAVVGWTFTW